MKKDFQSTSVFKNVIKPYKGHLFFGVLPLPFMSVRPLFIKIPITILISIVAFLCKLEIEGIILILIISIFKFF